ncbi:MAG TPA: hypothetical protein VF586_20700 [Pyrinomonadaceae bacterium]|jgi:sorbitol-specific phosphotransferase system component IIA
MSHANDQQHSKISPDFRARLNGLDGRQRVRAIVLLRTGAAKAAGGRRQNTAERRAAIEAVRRSAETALPEIDRLLKQFDGRRLTDEVGALGSVPVETTAEGVDALAALEQVKVIVEDQPVSLLR